MNNKRINNTELFGVRCLVVVAGVYISKDFFNDTNFTSVYCNTVFHSPIFMVTIYSITV